MFILFSKEKVVALGYFPVDTFLIARHFVVLPTTTIDEKFVHRFVFVYGRNFSLIFMVDRTHAVAVRHITDSCIMPKSSHDIKKKKKKNLLSPPNILSIYITMVHGAPITKPLFLC